MVARIEAALRRFRDGAAERPARLLFADIELDENAHEVWRAGDPIPLSPTEFKLLRHFMANAGRVLSAPCGARSTPPSRGSPARCAGGSRAARAEVTGVPRRPAARVSLRTRLIAVVLALVALALVVISVVSVSALRSHLRGETDDRLRRIAVGMVDELDDAGGRARGLPSTTAMQLRAKDGRLVSTVQDEAAPPLPRDMPDSPAELAARSGRPSTLTDDENGRSWRVLVLPACAGHLLVATDLADLERTVDRRRPRTRPPGTCRPWSRFWALAGGLAATLLIGALAGGQDRTRARR
ncbi:winged helix-turn-helix domain-containing protein [Actinomadura sp. 3N508]|uniref:winged helix-turn-helix domain-containing protein n=1 Tax=Actinomadura sp. 3N508 TaxID=3375153 RepID=UPI0037A4157B